MRKKDIKDNKTLNEYYLKARKIRFINDREVKNVEDIILRLWYKNEDTVYIKKGIHSGGGKYRSINDYLLLCKNYFPLLSVKDVMNIFSKHQQEFNFNNLPQIIIRYCEDIKMTNSGGTTRYPGYNKFINNTIDIIELGVNLRMNPKSWDFKSN